MDFKELMKFADTADTVNAVVIYAFFGVAALLLILLILWGIMKLSNFISTFSGYAAGNKAGTGAGGQSAW